MTDCTWLYMMYDRSLHERKCAGRNWILFFRLAQRSGESYEALSHMKSDITSEVSHEIDVGFSKISDYDVRSRFVSERVKNVNIRCIRSMLMTSRKGFFAQFDNWPDKAKEWLEIPDFGVDEIAQSGLFLLLAFRRPQQRLGNPCTGKLLYRFRTQFPK